MDPKPSTLNPLSSPLFPTSRIGQTLTLNPYPPPPQLDSEASLLEQRLRSKESEIDMGMRSFLGADGGGNVWGGVWVPMV